MRPQAHVASGLLVWSVLRRPLREAPVYALAANLPDLDRPVAKRLGVKGRRHHVWLSHSAVFWVAPSVAARRRPSLVACVWIHLVLDTYADGIVWLWPAHREKIGLFRKPPEIVDDGWNTPAPLSTGLGRAEAAMWVGAGLALIRRR
jgi:hypothetical protein